MGKKDKAKQGPGGDLDKQDVFDLKRSLGNEALANKSHKIDEIIEHPDLLISAGKMIDKSQLRNAYQPLRVPNKPDGKMITFQNLSDLKTLSGPKKNIPHPALPYMHNVLTGKYKIYKSEKYGFVICEPK